MITHVRFETRNTREMEKIWIEPLGKNYNA